MLVNIHGTVHFWEGGGEVDTVINFGSKKGKFCIGTGLWKVEKQQLKNQVKNIQQ